MPIKTGLEDAHYFSSAELNGHIYLANGWDVMQRWNGVDTATVDAGISAGPQDWNPTPSTASGLVTAGLHLLRYRYKSKDTGYVSDPSNAIELTVAAGAQQLTFAVAASGTANIVRSADAKVDQIIVEMTTVGSGTPFYEAVTITQTASTAVVNLDDDALVGAPLDWADTGHLVPPAVSIIVGHRGRLLGAGRVVHSEGTLAVTNSNVGVTGTSTNFLEACVGMYLQVTGDSVYYQIASRASGTSINLDEVYAGSTASGRAYKIFSLSPNTIYETLPLYPESWPALKFTKVLVAKSDRVTGMIGYYGDLIVCGDRVSEKWSYNVSLVDDGQAYAIPGDRGAINNRCLIEQDGIIYGWDTQGIWKFSGGAQQHISYPVDPIFALMNWAVSDTFHTVFIPLERTIRFYWARADNATTDTLPKDFLEYHVDTDKWGTGRHRMAITASATIGTGAERRAVVGDENGHWWFVLGSTEGAAPQTTLTGTVSSGATSAQFNVDEGSLYTTGSGLAGAPIYSVGLGEETICSSNTANQINVSPSFSTAPATGSKVYIGRINSLLKTKAVKLGRLDQRQRPRFLHLHFEPAALSLTLLVRFYVDYSSTAYSWTKTDAAYSNGVSITSGSTNASIDLSTSTGYARLPLGHLWLHTIEIEMEYIGPAKTFSLVGWEIDGVVDDVVKVI